MEKGPFEKMAMWLQKQEGGFGERDG